MTQSEIAKRLDIKPQAVSKWYTGKSLPSQIHLFALAKLLNENPEALLQAFLKKHKDKK